MKDVRLCFPRRVSREFAFHSILILTAGDIADGARLPLQVIRNTCPIILKTGTQWVIYRSSSLAVVIEG